MTQGINILLGQINKPSILQWIPTHVGIGGNDCSNVWCNTAPGSGPIREIILDRAKSSTPGIWSDEERDKKGDAENSEREPFPELQKKNQILKKPAETPPRPGDHHVHPIRTFSLSS
ncbi:hypothetical protein TNCV_3770371 [Trichonephila clavipes]|nr:hypothetical protein TNCV_3770371 [Trichonephila clavipes]